jgi:hypothetical protein
MCVPFVGFKEAHAGGLETLQAIPPKSDKCLECLTE